MTAATLAPSFNTALTYSGGNLTCTQPQTNVNAQAGGATHLYPGNKYYWEVTFNAGGTGFSNNSVCGVVSQSKSSWNNTNFIGSDTTGVGYNSGGAVQYNNSTLSTIASYAVGANIGIALDLVNNEIWFRPNGGNWNHSGTANPATNTGGISISGITTTYTFLLPALGFYFNGQQETINLGNSAFSYTAPSGFGSPNTWPPAGLTATSVHAAYGSNEGFTPAIAAAYPRSNAIQPYNAPNGGQFSPAGSITHVSGYVEESGLPVAGKTVRAYDSVSGQFLGYATSASDGSWSIPALGRVLVDASARDDPNYDGIIHVRITPV